MMKDGGMSSNRTAMSSSVSVSDSVFETINDIESTILHSPVCPREESMGLLMQLSKVKLQLLEGELGMISSSNDESSGDDEEYSSSMIRSRSIRRSNSGPIRPDIVKHERVPFHISIEGGNETSSQVSSLGWPYSAGRSLEHKRTICQERSTVSPIPERPLPESKPVAVTPDLRIVEKTGPPPLSATAWDVITYMLTFFVNDVCIPRKGPSAKKAWREKVAIFVLFLFVSACFVLVTSILPILFCPTTEGYYDAQEVLADGYIHLFGRVYDVRSLANYHPQSSRTLEQYYGKGVSHLFPRLPPAELPRFCLNEMLGEEAFNGTNAYGLQNTTCVGVSAEEEIRYGDQCHTSIVGNEQISAKLGKYEKGYLVLPRPDLLPSGLPDGTQYITIDNVVYNVTQYVSQSRNPYSGIGYKNSTDAYLSTKINDMIFAKVNADATFLFHDIFSGEDKDVIKGCLNDLFYHAQIDTRYQASCDRLATAQYILAGILCFLIVVQVVCSLFYIARRPHFVKDEEMQKGILVMVPCYNESRKELSKTIDSVLHNDYPNEKRILVVVADGVITGAGEAISCPQAVASLLGFDFDPSDPAYPYNSLGAIKTNFVSIYSGLYTSKKCPEKKMKYIVLVKQGCPQERYRPRAGNRGKRDSQVLLFGILNRLQHGRKLTDLDLQFVKVLDSFGLCHRNVEYLMTIDADTRISDTSLKLLVHKLENDRSVLACCGETRVENKVRSFVTMIQVFEYYSAHHLKKAFESVFGCVTCLPGCFTLYRLYTDELEPLLASDVIVSNYARNDISSLHERNLYELGEDRMLTTLLLQHFYGMKLSFVPEAVCWTIVPHTFHILRSQRRRWINSTVHNMLELLKVQTMCGVCFFSMKMVVIFDLISTALLPSGCVYLYYIIIEGALNSDGEISPLAILAFSFIGLMVVPFVMRSQWEYFLWFFVFLIGGIPIFYLFLPVYAFWCMDDLSWGETRQVKLDVNRNDRTIEMGGESTCETCPHQGLMSQKTISTAITPKMKTTRRKKEICTQPILPTGTLSDAVSADQPAAPIGSVPSMMTSHVKPKSKTKAKESATERQMSVEPTVPSLEQSEQPKKKRKAKRTTNEGGLLDKQDESTMEETISSCTDPEVESSPSSKKTKKKMKTNKHSTGKKETAVNETISSDSSPVVKKKKRKKLTTGGSTRTLNGVKTNKHSTGERETGVNETASSAASPVVKKKKRKKLTTELSTRTLDGTASGNASPPRKGKKRRNQLLTESSRRASF